MSENRFGERIRAEQRRFPGHPVRLFPAEVEALADAVDRDAKEERARLRGLLERCLEVTTDHAAGEGVLLADLRRELERGTDPGLCVGVHKPHIRSTRPGSEEYCCRCGAEMPLSLGGGT